METDNGTSDGIARVHGMSNVQAEELVEYVDATNLPSMHAVLTSDKVRVRSQGHVHESGAGPSWCRAFWF